MALSKSYNNFEQIVSITRSLTVGSWSGLGSGLTPNVLQNQQMGGELLRVQAKCAWIPGKCDEYCQHSQTGAQKWRYFLFACLFTAKWGG